MVIAGGSPGIALIAGLIGGFGLGIGCTVTCIWAEQRAARRRAEARRSGPRLATRNGRPVADRRPATGGRSA